MTDVQFAELQRLQKLEVNVSDLIKNLRPGKCRDCDAVIYWGVEYKTGARVPLNADLTNHRKTCVRGEQHQRDSFNNRELLPVG